MAENEMNWEKIADILIEEFSENKYSKDEKMPSENRMAVRFGVPRSEIRRAYERLKELGYIYSMQGYGSFFSGKKEKIQLLMTDSTSFSEKMEKLGLSYKSENLGIREVKGNSLICEMLDTDITDTIYRITRLRYIEGSPAAIHISYVTEKKFPHIREDGPYISSLFEYMKQCGYQNFSNESSELTVSALTAEERKLLDVHGYAPCLVLSSRCINREDGTVLEAARTIYRGDRFIFTIGG